MGSARGVSGVAMNTSIMEQVPKHFMGRVQNTFYFAGTLLQISSASRSAGSRRRSAWREASPSSARSTRWLSSARSGPSNHGRPAVAHAAPEALVMSQVADLPSRLAATLQLGAQSSQRFPSASWYPFQFIQLIQETSMSFQLEGRIAVVFGVANKRSIAWSIAQGLHAAGMKLAITYQNERLGRSQGPDRFPARRRRLHVRCFQGRGHRPHFCPTQRALRQAARAGAQRGLRSRRGTERRVRQHHPRGLPHRARRQRVFADRARPRAPPRSWKTAAASSP